MKCGTKVPAAIFKCGSGPQLDPVGVPAGGSLPYRILIGGFTNFVGGPENSTFCHDPHINPVWRPYNR